MSHPRRFRFGVQVTNASSGADWIRFARRAEELGYDSLLMPDHVGDQLAPVPALMAAAAATTTLKIGTFVFGNDYRHPVVLAKEVATLDMLSDGRMEFGIGAGSMNIDYEQSGIPMHPAGVRIDRLAESIDVCKAIFAGGTVDLAGEYYNVSGYQGSPKPVQKPHPPILIGGGGKRVLTLAARKADIVGINPRIATGQIDGATAQDGAAARTDEKLRWVRTAAGDRYDDIEINMLVVAVVLTNDAKSAAGDLAPLFDLHPLEVADYPMAWIGTEDEIVDTLQTRRERWDASYLVVRADAMESAAPIVARLRGT